MGYTTEITTYQCYWCNDIVVTEKFPDGTIENIENVNVFNCKTQTGLVQPTCLCIRCRDLIRQVLQEELQAETKK
jgi:hypothetical protein